MTHADQPPRRRAPRLTPHQLGAFSSSVCEVGSEVGHHSVAIAVRCPEIHSSFRAQGAQPRATPEQRDWTGRWGHSELGGAEVTSIWWA